MRDYALKQLGGQEWKPVLDGQHLPSTAASWGVLCSLPYLKIMQLKRKIPNEKKQHRAGTKGLFTHQHFTFWQVFAFLPFFFFLEIIFLS